MPTQHNFIDMHIHLFTARYLPLHGIFRSYGIFSLLARGLARLAVSLTAKSDFDSAPKNDQQDMLDALQKRDLDLLMHVLIRRIRKMVADARVPRSDADTETFDLLLSALDDIQQAIYPELGDIRPIGNRLRHDGLPSTRSVFEDKDQPVDALDALLATAFARAARILTRNEFFEDAVHMHGHQPFDEGTGDALLRAGIYPDNLPSVGKLLVFFVIMTLSERNRYKALEQDYRSDNPADIQGADLYVGILLDMNGAYEARYGNNLDRPDIRFKKQIDRMEKLAAEKKGQLITFAAVDPFRGSHWQSNVDYALNTHGIKNFKIYPPLGFRAFESKGYVTPVNPNAKDASEYIKRAENPAPHKHAKKAMKEIIDYFGKRNLRLFSHCNPKGFEVRKGYGIYADPHHWRQAIEDSGHTDLRLFLAHGGGALDVDWYGWAAETDSDFQNSFAYRAIRMAQKYQNVYLGMGHILRLFDPQQRDRVRDRLIRLIEDQSTADGTYPIQNKICYGSDWSMPEMIGRTREYLNAWYDIFDHSKLKQFAPLFFKTNAESFLNS